MSFVKGFCTAILTDSQFQGMDQVNDPSVLIFTHNRPLPIRLDWYVEHVLDQLSLPEEILVCSFNVVEKYLSQGLLCQFNIHNIVFTSISVCQKFVVTPWINNASLEKVGGIKKGSLLSMESSLLNFINWKFNHNRFQETRIRLQALTNQENSKEDSREDENDDINGEFICNDDCLFPVHSELQGYFSVELFESL